jgi:hypothetical protein
MGFDVHNIYISILYFLGCSIIWYVSKEFPVLPFSASILFIINQRIRRFADEQSMYLVFVSCFASRMMLIPWSWGALAAFILVANPFPFLLGLSNLKKQRLLTWIPKKTPYDHTSLLDGLKNFLSSVPASKRVLMAFDDPHDRYESVFDGFRILRDTVAYVANKQCIHLFPDWFAVAETNYEGSPGFWGRSREKVLENMKQWGAEYAIIYQESGTTLDASWQDEFEVLSTFDWGEWSNELCGEEPWSSEITPKWWLLKRNSF